MKYLNKNLKYLIEERCVTKAKLARRMGITRHYLHILLTGKQTMPIKRLIQLCKFFQVNEHDMLHVDLRKKEEKDDLSVDEDYLKIIEEAWG